MSETRPIVAVGLRPGFVQAARRLGQPLVAVVERAPGPKAAAALAHAVVADLDGRQWDGVAAGLAEAAPAAVVALTERAVVPAAHLRAALGLPGQSVASAVLCSDKRAMKRAARAAGLRCADVVEAEEGLSAGQIVERLGLPLVVKHAVSSGGRGTVVARRLAEVPSALPPGAMAESFVDGVEMSVETFCLGDRALLVNPTEYVEPAWSSLVPADLGGDLEAVTAHAEAARRALGVSDGIAHLEVFRTADGLVFGEMAARPPGGHLMRLIELAYGFDPWQAVLQIALGQDPGLPDRARQSAAVRILHPGVGTVGAVENHADGLPGVEEVSIRVRPGDALGVREGTGQEAGHVVVSGADAAQARARLAAAVAEVRVELDGAR